MAPMSTPSWRSRRAPGTTLCLALWALAEGAGCTAASTANPDGGGPAAAVCLPLDAGVADVGRWLGVDAGPAGEPLERFTDDYYAAFCDAQSRCLPFEHYLVSACLAQLRATGMWTSPTACGPVSIGTECAAITYDLTAVAAHAAAAGRNLSYSPQLAAACLATPWTVCSIWYQGVILPPVCAQVFGPVVSDGGACQADLECVAGMCAMDAGTCTGTCVPSTPPPPAYRPGSICAYGTGCGIDAGLTCDGLYCRGDAGLGSACADVGLFGCAAGLFCDESGSCQPQVPRGGACVYSAQADNLFVGPDLRGICQAGLVCRGEALLTDGGLRPGTCELPSGLGQSCSELAADEVHHRSGCMAGAVCSCGVCVPPPVSGTCAEEWTPCLPYVAACDYQHSNTCLPLTSFDSCWNGQQCSTGYCESTGTCGPPPPSACPG